MPNRANDGRMTTHESEPLLPTPQDGKSTDSVRSFALTEDWLATIVGLSLVALILLGVITPDWLPL